MKILVVTQYFYPESFRINDLVQGLMSRGHEVDVLTGLPNYPTGNFFDGYSFLKGPFTENYEGATVYRVPLVSRGKKKGFRLLLNYFSFAFFASLLVPFRCRKRYDHIFVFELSPITVALPAIFLKFLRPRTSISMWVTDLWPESLTATGVVKNKLLLFPVELLIRFIYFFMDEILISSRAFSSSIEKYTKSKYSYFPYWAESLYLQSPKEEELPRSEFPQGFSLLFAGNIGTSQGFDTLIEAAAILKYKIPDIHWVILGEGLGRESAEQRVRELGLQSVFHFLGRRKIEEMPRYYACADALLVSLKKDPLFEITVPSKLQSCLAAGKPIIGSIDGEAAKIIKEAGSLCAKAGDAEALAQVVAKLYGMPPEERAQMGRAAKQYFLSHFEREMLISKLENIIGNLV